MPDLCVEDWVKAIFDHPVKDPAWYWDVDGFPAEDNPSQAVALLTAVYQQPVKFLGIYSDEQVAQGLWFLASASGPFAGILSSDDPSVPWHQRRCAILSIYQLFEKCFSKRCSDHLSYLDEDGANPLNSICYMWWEIFPAWPEATDGTLTESEQAFLDVMIKTLSLPSGACRESALHGLGHWTYRIRGRIEPVIEQFLHKTKNLRPELIAYALRAARGEIQ